MSESKAKKAKVAGVVDTAADTGVELQFEECPKWQALKDILEEIEEDCKITARPDSSVCRVLVAAQDDGMCAQIKEVEFVSEF